MLLFAALLAGLLGFQVYAVFLQPYGVPSAHGRDTRWVGEVAGAVAVRQSFKMEADGFEAVTLHLRPTGGALAGQLVVELSEIVPESEQEVPVYRVSKPAADLAGTSAWTWRFNPLDDSRGRVFAVQVSLPATGFGHGLDLLATRDEEYRDGRLWVDGREQWGDLVFETQASRATAFHGGHPPEP